MNVAEHLAEHDGIRAKMIAKKYPRIDNPITTVDFMIYGLKINPTAQPAGVLLYNSKREEPYEFWQGTTDIHMFTPHLHAGPATALPSIGQNSQDAP